MSGDHVYVRRTGYVHHGVEVDVQARSRTLKRCPMDGSDDVSADDVDGAGSTLVRITVA